MNKKFTFPELNAAIFIGDVKPDGYAYRNSDVASLAKEVKELREKVIEGGRFLTRAAAVLEKIQNEMKKV